MKKVVILGSGLASRLQPITNHIPKVLVNYKHHTILKHLHDTYSGLGADEIIVVVNSKFKPVVDAYAKQHDLNIITMCVDEAYGSAYALSRIAYALEGHNVVLNWCDVIPKFEDFCWDSDVIYTHGSNCRYSFDGYELKKVGLSGGNVVGIYQSRAFFIKSFYSIGQTHDHFRGEDYVSVLDPSKYNKYSLKDLVDIGDMDKLRNTHMTKEYSRDFNSITICDDIVFKTALTPAAQKLQRLESQWYSFANCSQVAELLPSKGLGTLRLKRIIGTPLFESWHEHNLDQVFNALDFDPLDKLISRDRVDSDHYYEIVTKIKERCKSIKDVVNSFPKVTRVNGVEIGRLDDMLERAYRHIIDNQIDKPYSIIHGDPNFSNLMSETGTGFIRVIDPRGYFGKTEIFGPKMYDEAKVLYALSGYDEFNSSATWGALEINPKSGEAFINIEPLCEDSMNDPRFTDLHHLWNAIIWLGLGGYFKNNPLKSVAAYYYGMMLLSSALHRMGRKLEDGSCVKTLLSPATFSIKTKCPEKWLLTDLETGVEYKPSVNCAGYKLASENEWVKV